MNQPSNNGPNHASNGTFLRTRPAGTSSPYVNHNEQIQNLMVSNQHQNRAAFLNESQQQRQPALQETGPPGFGERWTPTNETQRTTPATYLDLPGSIYASSRQGALVPGEALAHTTLQISNEDLFLMSSQGMVSGTPQQAGAADLSSAFLGYENHAVYTNQAYPGHNEVHSGRSLPRDAAAAGIVSSSQLAYHGIPSPTPISSQDDLDETWQRLLDASVNWNMRSTLNMHELASMRLLCEISAQSLQRQRQSEELPETILAMLIQEQRQQQRLMQQQRTTALQGVYLQEIRQQVMTASTLTPSQRPFNLPSFWGTQLDQGSGLHTMHQQHVAVSTALPPPQVGTLDFPLLPNNQLEHGGERRPLAAAHSLTQSLALSLASLGSAEVQAAELKKASNAAPRKVTYARSVATNRSSSQNDAEEASQYVQEQRAKTFVATKKRSANLPAAINKVDNDDAERATKKRSKQSEAKVVQVVEATIQMTPDRSEKYTLIHSPTDAKISALEPTSLGSEELVECLSFEEAFLSTLSECDEPGIHIDTNGASTNSSRLLNCPLSRKSMKSLLTWNEPHVGADILTRLALSNNEVPRKENCRQLLTTLTQGPQHGKISYPDCARMEIVKEYRDVLLQSKPRMCKKFANLQPYCWWAKVVDVVSQPSGIYCVEGDVNRSTSACLLRAGQSLLVKHSGMQTLEMILCYQLDPFCLKQGESAGITKSNAELSLRAVRLLDTLFSEEGGTLKALKQLVKASISNWIHHGHYQSAYFCLSKPEKAPDTSVCHKKVPPLATVTDVQFVSSAFRELYPVLGRLVSYMAWLHTVQDKAARMNDTAATIADVVKSELMSTTFDPTPFLTISAKEDHWKDIMLHFCMSLEKRVLGKEVAAMLGCNLEWFGEVTIAEESEVDEDELRAWLDEPVPDDWGL